MKKYLVVIFSRQQFDTFSEVVEAGDQDDAIAKAQEQRMQDLRDLFADDYDDAEDPIAAASKDAEEAFENEEYYVVAVVEIGDDADYSTMMDSL